MKKIIGTSNRILEIDLTVKKFSEVKISDIERKMYLGGKGLGLKLLYDRIKPGINPLGGDNIIIINLGVLMGTGAPCSGRFNAVAKSPLTGIITSSSCGGPFGMALKTSGWDGLIIRGKSKSPVHLIIDSKGVKFKSARSIWGEDTFKSQDLIKKNGAGSMVIGPAGENMVRYANICSGHRFFGRGGLGAVMGSKNLKAITAKGNEFKIIPKNKLEFDNTKKIALKYINTNKITSGSYRDFGTGSNVNMSNASGILPVKNFSDGTHKDAYKISGEKIAEDHDTKYATCKPCSILCGHKGNFNGKDRIVPEYETIGLLGSNLNIFDPVLISEWNEICGKMGMDTISAGSVIAWTMEAAEKKIYKSKLKFGSPAGISKILKDIAELKGQGKELAMGVRELSEKYGGKDFAIHVKGLEMAAYDPRGCYGQGLSYAVANRGACHLSTSMFFIEAYYNMASPKAKRGKAKMVKFFEDLNSSINSLNICQFTSYAFLMEPAQVKYTPMPVLKMLLQNATTAALKTMDISTWPKLWSAVTGINISSENFKTIGERIHVLERFMNTREGITIKNDTLPGRLLEEGRKSDPIGLGVPLSEMLDRYYKVRGYNSIGIPLDSKLKELGIEKK